jgi:Peptidase family M48
MSMTRIGPKTFPTRTVPVSKPAAPPARVGTETAPKDLIELNTGSPVFALKKGLKNAGSFMLRNGLPFVGAALGGPVGLVVGAVATGTIEYLDRPDQAQGARLGAAAKKALVTSAMAGGLGLAGMLWAPLGPLLQTGVAALGSAAAGMLEFGVHHGQKDMTVDLGKFASEYKKRAKELLATAGQPKALKDVRSGFALSEKARKYHNQIALVQTAAVVNHLLGPGVAVALAGDIGRERVDASALSRQIDQFYNQKSVSEHTVDGVQVRRVDGLAERDRSMGMALYNVILMDSNYHPEAGDAKTDFILGHEISHVRHRDSSATMAQRALKQAVNDVSHMTDSPREKRLLVDLENELNEAMFADSRNMETRADKDGLEYARNRGHNDPEIMKSAQELFGQQDGPDTFQNHPNGTKRTAALQQSMEQI